MMIRGCRRGRGAALTALACATCVVLAVLAGPVGARRRNLPSTTLQPTHTAQAAQPQADRTTHTRTDPRTHTRANRTTHTRTDPTTHTRANRTTHTRTDRTAHRLFSNS